MTPEHLVRGLTVDPLEARNGPIDQLCRHTAFICSKYGNPEQRVLHPTRSPR